MEKTKRRGATKLKKLMFGSKNVKRCAYCGKGLTLKSATFDHVRPLSSGGYHKRANGKLACKECNNAKGSMALGTFVQRSKITALTATAVKRP